MSFSRRRWIMTPLRKGNGLPWSGISWRCLKAALGRKKSDTLYARVSVCLRGSSLHSFISRTKGPREHNNAASRCETCSRTERISCQSVVVVEKFCWRIGCTLVVSAWNIDVLVDLCRLYCARRTSFSFLPRFSFLFLRPSWFRFGPSHSFGSAWLAFHLAAMKLSVF